MQVTSYAFTLHNYHHCFPIQIHAQIAVKIRLNNSRRYVAQPLRLLLMSGSVRCCIKSVTDVALAHQYHTLVVQAEVTFRVRKDKRRQLLRRVAKGNNIGLRDRFCFQVPHLDPESTPCSMVLIWTNKVPYPPPSACHHAPDFTARPCIGRETCPPQRSSGETYSVILSTYFFQCVWQHVHPHQIVMSRKCRSAWNDTGPVDS